MLGQIFQNRGDWKASNCQLDMPDSFVFRIDSHSESCEELHFMQDGVPRHFAHPVRAWLNNHFPGRWIGRRGTKNRLREVPILLHVIYFCGASERGDNADKNHEHLVK